MEEAPRWGRSKVRKKRSRMSESTLSEERIAHRFGKDQVDQEAEDIEVIFER